jgi:hypothetical protein
MNRTGIRLTVALLLVLSSILRAWLASPRRLFHPS